MVLPLSSVSMQSDISSVDATVELAAKESVFEIIQKDIKHKEKLREMEEQHRRELDSPSPRKCL